MTGAASAELTALVRRARVLLLDFDGPICSIFAGTPAANVSSILIEGLARDGHAVPDGVRESSDPLEVLRYAGGIDAAAARTTEKRLRAAELDAVSTARPTPHARRVIEHWRDSGRAVAIVSNNSDLAVKAYLARIGLSVNAVVGRTGPDPSHLKPNPLLVRQAIAELDADASESLFVGDSTSDITAGIAAGVSTVGYANKPGKAERLAASGAAFVIDTIAALLVDADSVEHASDRETPRAV